jgi:hypothetical protein
MMRRLAETAMATMLSLCMLPAHAGEAPDRAQLQQQVGVAFDRLRPIAIVEAAELEGDVLTDLILARELLQMLQDPDEAVVPGGAARLQGAHDRLRDRVMVGAKTDWRTLALLVGGHGELEAGLTRHEVLELLAELDPENAYVQLQMLRGHSCCERDHVSEDAARRVPATRYESPADVAYGALRARFARVPAYVYAAGGMEFDPPETASALAAIITQGALTIASMRVVEGCDEPGQADLATCAQLLTTMMRDADQSTDVLLAAAELSGLGDETLRAMADESMRELAWLGLQEAELVAAPETKEAVYEVRATYAGNPNGLDASRAVLTALDVPLTPPPGWDLNQERRSRVTED